MDSLAQHGETADSRLKQFGFTSEQFKAENLSTVPNRLPYQLGVSLAHYIWKQLGDENLGLSEKVLPTGGFPYAGRLAVNADNLGEALELMIGFFILVKDLNRIPVIEARNR